MIDAIVLDTNLLILLVVGLTNEKYISSHKSLSAFSVEDFRLLRTSLEETKSLIVTPNTLTETSNLLRYIKEPAKSEIHGVFDAFVRKSREVYVKSNEACLRQEFVRLGLTDNAILEVAKNDVLILSADLDLCIAAEIAQYKVVNFNHLRDRD